MSDHICIYVQTHTIILLVMFRETERSCMPVQHSEKEDQATIDVEFYNTLLELHKRVNPKEAVVGWYSTGDQITYVSSLIHDVYKSFVTNPVHLTVDTSMTNYKLAAKAYRGRSFKVGDKPVIYRFEDAELETEVFEGEKIAVDALLNGVPDDEKLDAPATVLSDLDNLEVSLSNVLSSLEVVSEYVNKVTSGAIKGDPEIGRAIAHALSAIPVFDADSFETVFNTHMQDLLMIMYLSNLTRTQIALADKISNLV